MEWHRTSVSEGPRTPFYTHTHMYVCVQQLTHAYPWSAEGFVPCLLPSLA